MKKLFLILLAVAMCLSMVACGDSGTGDLTTGDTPKTEDTTGDSAPQKLSVYMPDGAPALAMAYQMHNNSADKYQLECHVVDASTIAAYVTGEAPAADICIMPINAAAKLLGSGSMYKLLGSVTNGNLYIISKNGVQITKDNVSELVGKTVGVVNLANVPGLTTQIVLTQHNLKYNIVDNQGTTAADAVNLVAVNAQDITPAGTCDYYVIPQPAAAVKVDKAGFTLCGSIQELYSDDGIYPQAVLVVKNDLLSNNPDLVQHLEGVLTANAQWLPTAPVADVTAAVQAHLTEGMTPSLSAATLTADAIAGCNIKYVSATDNRDYFKDFVDKLLAVNPASTAEMNDNFFYNK